tara:strand:+ start:187 stop:627 length:441 start_codon:yes stop_codon:yes gene_type:complete
MPDELNQIVDNLRKPAVWIRIVFMVAFAVVLYLIIAPVILVVIMAQILFVFIAGSPNSNLRDFSIALVEYIFQILKFLIYATDNKPFPFSNFPSVQDDKFNINNEPEIKKDTKVMTGEESEEKDEDVEVEIKLAKKTAVKKRPKKK